MTEGLCDAFVSGNSATTKHLISKLESRAYRWRRDPTFSQFHTIEECNRHTHTHKQTDGQTHDDGMYHA